MPSQKSIPISELITTANSELLRLDFKRSALQIYCAEFRKFSDYYSNEKIQDYTATTGREYFQSIYGVNIASPRLQLTKSQSATRRAIRLLDDIFQFGYALRYCHRSYTVNPEYDILLESYLMKCRKKHNSQGTLRTKQMKLCQFFEYIEGRNIQLACLTSADLSNFMTTLCRCRRPTLYTTASVLKDFLRYLYESEQFTKDLSADVPKPKIYTDEDIPETWTPAEVKQLLSAVDRSNPIGKRDYAMFLLAILLGMRAGDICNLRFKNLDWNQKLITYTQQKSGKVSALPLLPVIGEAIIDYCKNFFGKVYITDAQIQQFRGTQSAIKQHAEHYWNLVLFYRVLRAYRKMVCRIQHLFNFSVSKYIGPEIAHFFGHRLGRNFVCGKTFSNYKIQESIYCADISEYSVCLLV